MALTTPLPLIFEGIGYTGTRDGLGDGLPLKVFRTPVPQPGPDQILVHSQWSSLNPLEYKLAGLNFLGRTPPVVLGFDLAGIVVGIGRDVLDFAIGNEVMAMADSNGEGCWAAGATGGYALTRNFLTAKKPATVSFRDAAALPTCFLSAFLALHPHLHKGDAVYIPGGGGGVGHLAVQMAARTLGARIIVSSGSSAASLAVARASGATHVFNYKTDDIAAEISALTGGRGVDLVFDATYSESGFIDTAQLVRSGGIWAVLGVGPGKTSRVVETESPVEAILAERDARHVNINLLRYFTDPLLLDADGKALLQLGMQRAAQWACEGKVVPHVGRTIAGTPGGISDALADMAAGRSPPGKVVVSLS